MRIHGHAQIAERIRNVVGHIPSLGIIGLGLATRQGRNVFYEVWTVSIENVKQRTLLPTQFSVVLAGWPVIEVMMHSGPTVEPIVVGLGDPAALHAVNISDGEWGASVAPHRGVGDSNNFFFAGLLFGL